MSEATMTGRRVLVAVVFAVFVLAFTLLAVLLFVTSGHASHTNERADPSVWYPTGACTSGVPPVCTPQDDDGYVFTEDPCVKALLAAMAQPFLPTVFDKEDGLWGTKLLLTEDGMRDFEAAHRTWEETKLQCLR